MSPSLLDILERTEKIKKIIETRNRALSEFKPKKMAKYGDFRTCDSKNVIYVLECPCKLRYMSGIEARNLKHAFKNIVNIRKGIMTVCQCTIKNIMDKIPKA